MARRHPQQHDANQYGLDYESAGNERRALLLAALKVVGMMRYQQYMRLILNMQEAYGGEPLGWPISKYRDALGIGSDRTVQRWQRELEAAGLIDVIARPRERGGQRTNLVGIRWDAVKWFATDRGETTPTPQPAGHPTAGRQINVTPPRNRVTPPRNRVTPMMSPPYKELSSYSSSTSPAAVVDTPPGALSEEEEIYLEKLLRVSRDKIKPCPAQLEPAIRTALERGWTLDELAGRLKWFAQHACEWTRQHRPGALCLGIRDAQLGTPAGDGWPYQR